MSRSTTQKKTFSPVSLVSLGKNALQLQLRRDSERLRQEKGRDKSFLSCSRVWPNMGLTFVKGTGPDRPSTGLPRN
jgi:hypothetical protein